MCCLYVNVILSGETLKSLLASREVKKDQDQHNLSNQTPRNSMMLLMVGYLLLHIHPLGLERANETVEKPFA